MSGNMKRRGKRPKGRKTKTKTIRGLAKRVKALEKAPEWDHLDKAFNGGVVPTGTFSLLTELDRGSTVGTRRDQEVQLKSLQIDGYITQHASAVNVTHRYILFYDLIPADPAANPAVADILDTSIGSTINNHRELDNKHRFVILKDHILNTSATSTERVSFSIFQKLHKKALFNHNTATSGRKANMVYLLMLSSDSGNATTWVWDMRIRFTDE